MARRELTEEQRAARAAQLAEARAKRGQPRKTETLAAETEGAHGPQSAVEPHVERQAAAKYETLIEPTALEEQSLMLLAKALMGNPATEEAFRRAIAETARHWENTPPEAPQMREFLYHQMRAMRALRYQLGRLAQRGNMEALHKSRLKAV